jgi:hypothetical protein
MNELVNSSQESGEKVENLRGKRREITF